MTPNDFVRSLTIDGDLQVEVLKLFLDLVFEFLKSSEFKFSFMFSTNIFYPCSKPEDCLIDKYRTVKTAEVCIT